MTRSCRVSILLFLVILCLPLPVRAIGFTPLSIASLTDRADIVLQGTVLRKTYGTDPAGRIYTSVEIDVAEVWKGAVAATPLVVVHGGGTISGRSSTVSGQVNYDVGEEVVAFLVLNARGQAVTVGLMQGKFHIWKRASDGTRYVTSPFHGLPEEVRSGLKLADAPTEGPGGIPLTLNDLKNAVQKGHP